MLHSWLDSREGVGLVVTGMTRHGYQLGLDQRTGTWLAVFYVGSGGHDGGDGAGGDAMGAGAACGVGGGVA